MRSRGFTLVEILVTLALLGIFSTVALAITVTAARERAYYGRTKIEFRQIETALYFYTDDHGGVFPPDVSRGLPPGLETYLNNPIAAGTWPDAPYPGSEYDWDNWNDPITGEPIHQISVRFCPLGGDLSTCQFPNETWAAGFGVNSALYYCVRGPCRAHIAEVPTYPGYCINC